MGLIQNINEIISEKSPPEPTKRHITAIVMLMAIILTVGSLTVTDTIPTFMQSADSKEQCTKVVVEENCCRDEYAAVNENFAPIYNTIKWPGNKISDTASALTSIGVTTSCSCKAPEYKEIATVENSQCVLEKVKLADIRLPSMGCDAEDNTVRFTAKNTGEQKLVIPQPSLAIINSENEELGPTQPKELEDLNLAPNETANFTASTGHNLENNSEYWISVSGRNKPTGRYVLGGKSCTAR